MSIEQQCVIIEIGFAGEGLILCYLSMYKYKCLNKNWFDSAYAGHYAAFFFVKKVCRGLAVVSLKCTAISVRRPSDVSVAEQLVTRRVSEQRVAGKGFPSRR